MGLFFGFEVVVYSRAQVPIGPIPFVMDCSQDYWIYVMPFTVRDPGCPDRRPGQNDGYLNYYRNSSAWEDSVQATENKRRAERLQCKMFPSFFRTNIFLYNVLPIETFQRGTLKSHFYEPPLLFVAYHMNLMTQVHHGCFTNTEEAWWIQTVHK